MKNEELVNRLFDGSCSELEIEILIKKINSGDININDLRLQIRMHAMLEEELNPDQKGSQIFKVFSSLNASRNGSLSSKVMKVLPSKPKNNNLKWSIVGLAAALFLSFFVWQNWNAKTHQPLLERGSLEVFSGESVVSNKPVFSSTFNEIPLGHYGKFTSKDDINLTIFSNSEFKITENQIDFNRGKFIADIGKRNKDDPLQILTGDIKTTITGTKFCLNYLERNNQKDYLLQLFEGTIDVAGKDKKVSLKSKEFLYYSGTDRKWVSGKLTNEIDQNFDDKIIYTSPATLEWIPFFWEKWSPRRVSISSTKNNIMMTSQNGETTFLTSQVVKTLRKGIRYTIIVYPHLLKGKMEIGLKCTYEGKFSYLDAFEVEFENSKIKAISKQIRREGKNIGAPQYLSINDFKRLTFDGNISHKYYEPGETKTPTGVNGTSNEDFIEDVVFEMYIKTEANSSGTFQIGATKITR